MKKEIFTRSEVKTILTEAIKQARRRTQKPNTHGNGENVDETTGSVNTGESGQG